jgi:RNA polymerase sigma-70 factor (ECF subfamily)
MVHGLGVSGSDAEIYGALRQDLIQYATALVGPDSASDLLSAVMVRLLARKRLSDLMDARPYLFRAVLNEARGQHRRTVRNASAVAEEVVTHDRPNLQPEVLEAVMQLPVRQRAATYLVYWADCSTKEAARLMDIGEGTVKRYLVLARRRLKGKLNAHV